MRDKRVAPTAPLVPDRWDRRSGVVRESPADHAIGQGGQPGGAGPLALQESQDRVAATTAWIPRRKSVVAAPGGRHNLVMDIATSAADDQSTSTTERELIAQFASRHWVTLDPIARSALSGAGYSPLLRLLPDALARLVSADSLADVSRATDGIIDCLEESSSDAENIRALARMLSDATENAANTPGVSRYNKADFFTPALKEVARARALLAERVQTLIDRPMSENYDLLDDVEFTLGGLLALRKAGSLRFSDEDPVGYKGPAANHVKIVWAYAVPVIEKEALRSPYFARMALHCVLTAMMCEARAAAPFPSDGKPPSGTATIRGGILRLLGVVATPFSVAWAMHLAPSSPWLAGAALLPALMTLGTVVELIDNPHGFGKPRPTPPEVARDELRRFLSDDYGMGLGEGTREWLRYLLTKGVRVPQFAFDLCAIIQSGSRSASLYRHPGASEAASAGDDRVPFQR